MAIGRKENLIIGVDIGTTKICAIVGAVDEDGIDIIGIGTHPSRGLRKGVVVNIESTVESIKKVIEEAELMAGCEISSVYTGIAGGHIKGFNSQGVIAIKERVVKESDVRRVVDAARAVAIPMDREVIHILPLEYKVDEQDGVKEPLGMSGVRLEAKVYIVTGVVTSAQNIITCVHRTGLHVSDIVLQSLASAEAVLSQDEQDLGVALVDIGGGTTDIAIFIDGSIKQTSVLSLGGNHITGDIAVGLRTPAAEAEKIKKKYGCAMSSMVSRDETIEVPSVGGRKPRLVPRQKLTEIIEPRVEEILTLVSEEINASGCRELIASGVVVTGGTAILEGLPEMAEEIFDLPVRRGSPTGIGGLVDVVNSPIYATGVGLVLYGSKSQTTNKFRLRDNHIFGKVRYRMQEWFAEFF